MHQVTKPPAWFWIAAALLTLWGLVGVAAFYMDVSSTVADRAKLDLYDQRLYASRPAWFIPCYGIAVWSGLIGSLLLLARKGLAQPLFVISLIGVVVMFGWMFIATDIIAHKGLLLATGFPVVIALLCALQIWLVELARRQEWIR